MIVHCGGAILGQLSCIRTIRLSGIRKVCGDIKRMITVLWSCLLQVDVLALHHNTLLLAYNDDSEASRSTLLLAMSTNEGRSWHDIAVLEADPRGSFHYPTLLYHEEQARL